MSLMISGCCCLLDSKLVVTAFLVTTCVVLCLVFYALFTKSDFTGCGPYLSCALFVLVFIGLFSAIGMIPLGNFYAYCGIAIFSLYLVYDVQMCVGSAKFGNEYSIDDFVLVAMNMYDSSNVCYVDIWIF